MDCQKCIKLLQALIEGDLDGAPDREMREHIEQCPDCRAEHERLVRMRDLLTQLRDVEVPEGEKDAFVNALMDRIEKERGKGWKRKTDWRPALVGAIAVVAVLIIFVSVPRPREAYLIEPAPGLNSIDNLRLDAFIMTAYSDHALATQGDFMNDPVLAGEMLRASGKVMRETHGDLLEPAPAE
jgi:hypothetical protein